MPKVFEPAKIGPLELSNRMIAEPMMSNTDIGGYVTRNMLDLYEERAAGGWGLVIVEASSVRRDAMPFDQPGVHDDEFLPGLTKLASAIHRGGSKAGIQLLHAGREANPVVSRAQVVGPSDNTPAWAGRKVRGLSTAEVEGVIESYAQAALRAKKAGFDAIMFHSTHGFLPQQFMSPWSNPDRTDRFAKPTQFAAEMIQRTREAVGPDMALIIRIPADEYRGEAGITLKMVCEVIAPELEKAGIDAIDITTGNWHRFDAIIPPLYHQRATLVPYAEEVKKVVKIPVVGVGRINDYRLVENLIEEGRVDFVGLGRMSFADPDMPRKMREGRYGETRKCIACDACGGGNRLPKSGIMCAINPTLMRSKEFPLTKVASPQKVLVVGGGVAGMEAARVAAQRGHDVTLIEKSEKLGGQVNISSNIPRIYTRELDNYAKQQMGWLKEAGVKVELGKEVTADLVRQMKPNVVLLAAGSRPLIPDIPGADGPNVITEEDAILKQDKIGKKVAILGAARGAEIAVSLASGGREVVILEALGAGMVLAAPYIFGMRSMVLGRMVFHNPNIKIVPEVKVKAITAEGVSYVDNGGNEGCVDADTVVLALGRVTNQELDRAILAIPEVDHVVIIGDARHPSNQYNAIHDGFFAGYAVGDPRGLEEGRLQQIIRTAGEQINPNLHGPNLDMELEWMNVMALPHMSPGREVRRAARISAESAGSE